MHILIFSFFLPLSYHRKLAIIDTCKWQTYDADFNGAHSTVPWLVAGDVVDFLFTRLYSPVVWQVCGDLDILGVIPKWRIFPINWKYA